MLLSKVCVQGVSRLASVSLSIGYPTIASAPHSLINGFKNLLAVAAVTDIEFKEANTVKEFLKVSHSYIKKDFLSILFYSINLPVSITS